MRRISPAPYDRTSEAVWRWVNYSIAAALPQLSVNDALHVQGSLCFIAVPVATERNGDFRKGTSETFFIACLSHPGHFDGMLQFMGQAASEAVVGSSRINRNAKISMPAGRDERVRKVAAHLDATDLRYDVDDDVCLVQSRHQTAKCHRALEAEIEGCQNPGLGRAHMIEFW